MPDHRPARPSGASERDKAVGHGVSTRDRSCFSAPGDRRLKLCPATLRDHPRSRCTIRPLNATSAPAAYSRISTIIMKIIARKRILDLVMAFNPKAIILLFKMVPRGTNVHLND
jgi:hypothetical protein